MPAQAQIDPYVKPKPGLKVRAALGYLALSRLRVPRIAHLLARCFPKQTGLHTQGKVKPVEVREVSLPVVSPVVRSVGRAGDLSQRQGLYTHPANKKERVCIAFQAGHCLNGQICKYAHDPAELCRAWEQQVYLTS